MSNFLTIHNTQHWQQGRGRASGEAQDRTARRTAEIAERKSSVESVPDLVAGFAGRIREQINIYLYVRQGLKVIVKVLDSSSSTVLVPLYYHSGHWSLVSHRLTESQCHKSLSQLKTGAKPQNWPEASKLARATLEYSYIQERVSYSACES